MPTLHPSEQTLSDFLLGKLPDPEHAAAEDHLTGCEECRAAAAAARPGDPLVELLAAAARSGSAPAAATPVPDYTPSGDRPTRTWGGAGPSAEVFVPPDLAAHPRYRVVRLLGFGGMGAVWLAEHTVMRRPVALKVIRPGFLSKPGAVERFKREVQAAARLSHPNIVTGYDAEEAGGTHFLVMEYVDGLTLAERVKAGPLPAAEACRAARDAARGLAAAHAAGLVHRDVNPHNLIRAADGTVKVLDFGLAGAWDAEDRLTGANLVLGTPDYIAPEQAADPRAADPRSDVYALGCTLYHLLAGRRPFPGDTPVKKIEAHRTRVPDPIPGLPPGLAAVLAKMMAKRPADRYQTADEVAAALDPFCDDTLGLGCDAAADRLRRRLAVAAAGLLFAALAAAGGVVYKIQRDNQEIVITTNDPDIEVVMKRNGEVVRIRDTQTGQAWELNTLTNQIGLADQPDGLELALPGNGAVVLRRHGKDVFRVTRAGGVPRPAPAGADRVAGGADAPWVDLLPRFDPKADAWDGSWARDEAGGRVSVRAEAGDTHLSPTPVRPSSFYAALPVRPAGGYELRVRFARTAGKDHLTVLLPVPGAPDVSAGLAIDGYPFYGGGYCHVEHQLPAPQFTPLEKRLGRRIVNDTPYTLLVRVTGDAGRVAVRAELEGKVVAEWAGSAADLRPKKEWAPPGPAPRVERRYVAPDPTRAGLCVFYTSRFRFDAVEFRPLSGTAELLRGPVR